MNAVDAALYQWLAAGTALTALLAGGTADPSVYQWLAPQGQQPPYVVFNQQSGVPVHTLAAVAYENELYAVKAVTAGPSAAAAGTIAAAIDARLADQPVPVAGHALMFLRRDSDLDYPEDADGVRYHHRGAMYRILIRPS